MASNESPLSGGGGNYRLVLTVNVTSQNIANNTTTFGYTLQIRKVTGSGYWSNNSTFWSVRTPVGTIIDSGTLGSYDFRNYTTLTLRSGSITVSGSATRTFRGVYDNAGGALGNAQVDLTITPPSIPTAPTGLTVTRVSDGQQDLSWSPAGSPVIQRRTDDGSFIEIARPGGSISSWSDTTTSPNRKYDYRVALLGGAGQSAFSETVTVYTSPAAPSTVEAERITQTQIRVTGGGLPPYGASYDVADGTTSNVIATEVSLPYDHMNPNPAVPHTYFLRAITPDGVSGAWSAASNTVQLIAPPAAPTNLSPNGIAVATGEPIPVTWRHNPVDSSEQSQYQIRYSFDGEFWTEMPAVASATQAGTIPAIGGPINGFVWEVRTWGADPDPSPYSATATIDAIDRPTTAINVPGATWGSSTMQTVWGYFQAQGIPQSAYQAQLIVNSVTFPVVNVSGGATAHTFSQRVADGDSYTVRVRTQANGVWSEWAEQSGIVEFIPPPEPTISGAWNESSGTVDLSFCSVSAPDPGEPIINEFTDPYFLGATTPQIVARNWIINPSFETGTSGWVADNVTVNRASSDAIAGDYRVTISTTIPPIPDKGIRYSGSVGVEDEEAWWTFSAYIADPSPTQTHAIWLDFYDENDSLVGSYQEIGNTYGERLVISTQNPTGGAYMIPRLGIPGVVPGFSVASFDAIMLHMGDTPLDYFDGATYLGTDPDFSTSWAGSAHASPSLLNGVRPAGSSVYIAGAPILSDEFAPAGGKSIRLIRGAEQQQFSLFGISLSGRVPEAVRPFGSLVISQHQKTEVGKENRGGQAMVLQPITSTPRAPHAAGSYDLSALWSSPLTTSFTLRLNSDGDFDAADVFFTTPTFVAGDYDGPPFTGDSGIVVYDGDTYLASWEGEPGESRSLLTPISAIPDPASMTLERSIDGGDTWELIGSFEPGCYNIQDAEALSCGETIYRLTAYSDEGAPAETRFAVQADSQANFIGGGVGFSDIARLYYEPRVDVPADGRLRAVEEYEGRERGIAYASRRLKLQITLSGIIFDEDPVTGPDEAVASTRRRLIEVTKNPYPVHCVRTFYGDRYYVALGLPKYTGLGRRPACAPDCADGFWSYSIGMEGSERE